MMTKVQQVMQIAVQSSWIDLAIETFEKSGNQLSAAEKTTLQALTVEELQQLKQAEERIKAGVPGGAGDDGGVF